MGMRRSAVAGQPRPGRASHLFRDAARSRVMCCLASEGTASHFGASQKHCHVSAGALPAGIGSGYRRRSPRAFACGTLAARSLCAQRFSGGAGD